MKLCILLYCKFIVKVSVSNKKESPMPQFIIQLFRKKKIHWIVTQGTVLKMHFSVLEALYNGVEFCGRWQRNLKTIILSVLVL